MKIPRPRFSEKRQFSRVKITEPKICQVLVSQTQTLWEGQGLIRNISLGGMYFACDRQPPLGKDDIRHLIFDTVHNDQRIYRLKLHVEVVRIEERQPDLVPFAVAIRFLSDPIYLSLNKIDLKELPGLDKTRIMYQYYRLNRQAYEIVKTTPEVRDEKINTIKARIDQGLYEVKSDELAQRLVRNLIQDNILIFKKE